MSEKINLISHLNLKLKLGFISLHSVHRLKEYQSVCVCVCVWMFDLHLDKCPLFQFSLLCCCCSVAKSCPTLCDFMNCSTPGFPVLHYLQEFAQTHVPWVGDAIQPSHPLSSPSPPAFDLSQHQGIFRVSSLHQVAKVLELQLQHQSFQWIFGVDFL